MKLVENDKFFRQTAYRLLTFIEKLQFSRKIMKIIDFNEIDENIKFSSRILSRSVIFTEKLQISGKITNFSENDQI